MIVIAIIGILAAVAVPQYSQYTKRARFAEVISAAAPVKTAIGVCLQATSKEADCDDWPKIGVTKASIELAKNVSTAAIAGSGDATITITAVAELDGKTYKLDPNYNSANNTLEWAQTGDCAAVKYC